MRDKQVREVELLLEVLEQVQHLGLDRDVERRDGLVADDQLGPKGERAARSADAGRPRTRGVAVVVLGFRPTSSISCCTSDLILLRGTTLWSRYGAPDRPTVLRGFSEANGSWKIICIATEIAEVAALGVRDVPALELDRPRRRLVQAHHHAGERRLPAPRLPHQPHRLALEDLQIHAVHRVHVADPLLEQDPAGDREELAEPTDADERCPLGRRFGLRSFGDLDAHERAMTSSWKMRSLSASDRWHRDA